MLFVPNGGNDFSVVASYGAGTRPTTTTILGTSVTPVTTNAYSNFTQIGNDLTQDCYGIYVNANTGFTNGLTPVRQTALQFSYDPAGTTNWTTATGGTVFLGEPAGTQGLMVSEANTYNLGGGVWYYFPIFIPAGASVAVSARSSVTTAIGVNIRYMTAPPNPAAVKRGSFVETLGLTNGAGTVQGTAVTPSTAATEPNTWTLIGTTTRRLWHWQIGCQHTDTTMTALNYHVDIGVGTSTTVVDPIIIDQYIQTAANENINNIPVFVGVEKMVPAGSQIYARVHNAGTNENAGAFQVVVYGTGG